MNMTKEKFTPGEWRTDGMYIYHGEDKIVCQMWGSGDFQKANAHLITAAPEMLDELLRNDDLLRDALKQLHKDSGLYREIEKQLEENKKALKKARGEK